MFLCVCATEETEGIIAMESPWKRQNNLSGETAEHGTKKNPALKSRARGRRNFSGGTAEHGTEER